MNNQFHIVLITTEGCLSCTIMENMLKDILSKPEYANVSLDKYDCMEDKVKTLNVTDFPTMIVYRDETPVCKQVGTTTSIKLERMIRDVMK